MTTTNEIESQKESRRSRAYDRKDVFGLLPHTIAAGDDAKAGLHISEKRERGLKVVPVPQPCHRFADDIPGGAKRRAGGGRFRDQGLRSCMVGVLGIKASVEE
ncbi:hypothetical protein [Nitrospira calida]